MDADDVAEALERINSAVIGGQGVMYYAGMGADIATLIASHRSMNAEIERLNQQWQDILNARLRPMHGDNLLDEAAARHMVDQAELSKHKAMLAKMADGLERMRNHASNKATQWAFGAGSHHNPIWPETAQLIADARAATLMEKTYD